MKTGPGSAGRGMATASRLAAGLAAVAGAASAEAGGRPRRVPPGAAEQGDQCFPEPPASARDGCFPRGAAPPGGCFPPQAGPGGQRRQR